jgi:pimeloyl-ACP methyl ester carboxylesterase
MGRGPLIVLVHGTFGRNSEWTTPGSTFLRLLAAQFPAPPLFWVFRWSGDNSEAARARAGIDLCRFLKALSCRWPAKKCYVIAHSHGGNIARQALSLPSSPTCGLVTLATPYLDFSARRLACIIHERIANGVFGLYEIGENAGGVVILPWRT